jgi:hypothetical protein
MRKLMPANLLVQRTKYFRHRRYYSESYSERACSVRGVVRHPQRFFKLIALQTGACGGFA